MTNSNISDREVIENYRNLHFIERAFRMNKTDLAVRPIYHRLFNRIEAHVCICFTAYIILLELERTLKRIESKKDKKNEITIYRAKFLAESLYEIPLPITEGIEELLLYRKYPCKNRIFVGYNPIRFLSFKISSSFWMVFT